MAIDSTLGVRPIDTGFLRDINRQQGAMLEQLGAQVRSDVAQVQTNRQLQGFSQAVQGIDPTSKGYAQQIIGAISSYPLAAQSPLGGAVINQLGAAHSLWQQEQAAVKREDAMLGRQLTTMRAQEMIDGRPFNSPVPTIDQLRNGTPGAAPSIPATNGPSGGNLGKVTSYGYESDPYGDSASLGRGKYKFPTGAWDNKLKPGSFAASPDVEAELRAAGVKPGQAVAVQLSNGQVVNGTWDDRTMQDRQATQKFGAPLRGRWDFYNPGGENSFEGAQVVGFRPAGAVGSPMASGGQQPSIPATNAPAMDMGAQIARKRAELERAGIPHKRAEAAMDQFVKDITRGDTTNPTGPIHRGTDGKLYRTQGDKFVEVRPPEGVGIVPSSSSKPSLPPVQQQELDDMNKRRDQLGKQLSQAEAKLQEAGVMWETAGSPWGPDKKLRVEMSKQDEEKAKQRLSSVAQLVESSKKAVDTLSKQIEDLDNKRRKLRGGEESSQPEEDIPEVKSAAEASKLAKGTKFRDPNGNIRIVP